MKNVVRARVEVQWVAGSSWWRLAERHLGDGFAWPRLVAANPGVCPVQVPVGTVIVIPDEEKVVPL